MFANNSQYQTNLNTFFQYLTSNSVSSLNGFYHTTAGSTTSDTVYGLFLCRGDQNVTSCSDCVTIATTTDLPAYCPSQKVAVIWYDKCMVRYSNEPMIGITSLDPDGPELSVSNDRNLTGNETRFEEILGNTMVEILIETAKGDGKNNGTKAVKISDSETLYALVQCTPDLSADSCYTCLSITNSNLKYQTDGSYILPTCNSRYSTSPFFNYSKDDISVPAKKI
ncbi:cysteine-rich receptor-like protein kinase 25 [Chenopodium quinoa]|uniref:cysteine-rich receptor-like protein kinase 25 n=1 Tax=Chenopodium quinoa TaxID=63459 RepID=UPI000B77D98C|nr:cysteine-rich receptor-like protein kinase 25 [Chenopodium quinoa]